MNTFFFLNYLVLVNSTPFKIAQQKTFTCYTQSTHRHIQSTSFAEKHFNKPSTIQTSDSSVKYQQQHFVHSETFL